MQASRFGSELAYPREKRMNHPHRIWGLQPGQAVSAQGEGEFPNLVNESKMIKPFVLGILFALLFLGYQIGYAQNATKGYEKPEECYQAEYTCVLKVIDGEPFFCLKATSQRMKDARTQPRSVKEVACVKRYPAILKEQPAANAP